MAEMVRRNEIYLSPDQLLERVRARMLELIADDERFDQGGLDVMRAADSLDDDACEMGGECSNSPVVIKKAIDVAAKALLIVAAIGEREQR